MQRHRVGATIIFIFCAVYGWMAFDIPAIGAQDQPINAATLPKFLALLGCTLALKLFFSRQPEPDPLGRLNWKRLLYAVACMLIYAVIIRRAGFIPATTFFLAATFWVMGERRIWRIIAVATLVSGIFWLLMTQLLGVYLPPWPEV